MKGTMKTLMTNGIYVFSIDVYIVDVVGVVVVVDDFDYDDDDDDDDDDYDHHFVLI